MTARSLADALRAASDESLAELLRARPELVTPVPADLGQLAARATGAPSVARALDRLDRWMLQVLEAVSAAERASGDVAQPVPVADVVRLLPQADESDVRSAIDRLQMLALVWGDDEGLTVVSGVRDVLGQHPGGLGPTMRVLLTGVSPQLLLHVTEDLGLAGVDSPAAAVEALVGFVEDDQRLRELLAGAPAEALQLLDKLAWGPPIGAVERARREVRAATASGPVDWLLAHGMLIASDVATVVLPREVALARRGHRLFADLSPAAPTPPVAAVRDRVDATAGAAAFAFVRATEELLEGWSLDPPSILKAGGLGVRELRRTAAELDLEEWETALVAETAYVAGLLGPSNELDAGWLPTPAYDGWRATSTEDRWSALAEAWLRTTRVAGFVGHRDDRGKVAAALGPDLDRTLAPEVRAAVLDVLAQPPTGSALDADEIEQVLAWARPRRPGRLRQQIIAYTLRESERLGITGQGALSAAGRALVTAGVDEAADALAPHLPEPLDHVLLQADLTAVAPGPLVSQLALELGLMADVESTGGATVYRFSEGSVRRALDAGRSASELHALLARHSTTPVPQPLTYLVDDIARRHGRIRVGAASSYIRCDDETTLSELLADKRVAELRLRRLAPTVVASQASGEQVLTRLRAIGLAPAGESADGSVLIRRPDSRRAPARQRPARLAFDLPAPGPALLSAAVRALRAGDRATQAPRAAMNTWGRHVDSGGAVGTLPRTAAAQTLADLQGALDHGEVVWIGYVDQHGTVSERVVEPVRLEGGYLTAYDHRSDEVRTFAVHRITGVALLSPADAVDGAAAVDGADDPVGGTGHAASFSPLTNRYRRRRERA